MATSSEGRDREADQGLTLDTVIFRGLRDESI
jgi:hypothetical protein